jgi:pectate lyase
MPLFPATATNASFSAQGAALNAPDQIFADSFEAGDLSAWRSNSIDNGDLSVSAAAALAGSRGLHAVLDDNNMVYVRDDSPNAEPRYRARFYFDPNSITMASGNAHFIFKGFAGKSREVLQMDFRQSSGAYQLRAGLLNDGSAWTYTTWLNISDASHFIEFDWRASTGAGANNGGLTVWIDGAQQADLTGVDNDTRRIDRIRLGALSGIDTGTRGTYFFDAFESRRLSYIGAAGSTTTQPPAPTAIPPTLAVTATRTAMVPPTATQTLMVPATPTSASISTVVTTPTAVPNSSDQIFVDSFEAGDLSTWSSSAADGGDLSASAAAALSGGKGLQTFIDDSNPISVRDDSPNLEPRYRVRFYFDPNSIQMANDDSFAILVGYTDRSTEILRVGLRRSSGNYQVRGRLLTDGSAWLNTNWFTISDASHFIELDWRASTDSSANNGGLTFWIDGVQQAELTGVDNDTRRIDYVQLGAPTGVDAGTRGTSFFDAFESRRQSYIGAAGGTTTQPPPPTATSSGPVATATNTPVSAATITQTPMVTATATSITTPTATPAAGGGPVVAFPGAEGFGAQSKGGRGGTVIEVTNLNDSGAGSLRACVAAQGPRICVFRVGGTITTQSEIIATNPYLTIAGQTAPGGGITLRAAQNYHEEPFIISTHDVVIRFVRFRAGASAVPNSSRRSLTINSGAYNVILDHCSFSWATDQPLLLIDGVHNTTVQWSIISEGLAHSTHSEGGVFQEHSTGLSVSGKNYKSTEKTGNITIHHNLLAHNGGRNPQNAGYGLEDVVNNVIYNWGGQGFTTHDLQADVPSNVVNNFFKPGVNTTGYEIRASHVNEANTGPRIYVSGNIGPRRTDDTQPGLNSVSPSDRIYTVSSPFAAPAVFTTSAEQAYRDVLLKAGTRIPMLDAVDKRIIEEVKSGGGRIIDCVSAAELTSPINCSTRVFLSPADYTRYGINDPLDSKGWPILAAGTSPQDSDHDGMPDTWETARGLNPNLNDSAQDRNRDGYTNIEEYINELVAALR